MFFIELVMQLIDHAPRFIERLSACRRNPVDPPSASGHVLQFGFEQTATLHPVQERIEGSRPDAIAVMFQFLHHGEAEDRLVRSMNEDMDAN